MENAFRASNSVQVFFRISRSGGVGEGRWSAFRCCCEDVQWTDGCFVNILCIIFRSIT